MIFTAAFVLGYLFWEKMELRRLGVEWMSAPKLRFLAFGRIKGFHLPEFAIYSLIGLDDFEVRPSDIWVCTFPKSGTTWMQEIVYLMANDVDFAKAKSAPLDVRSPYLEFDTPGRAAIADYPSPRVIKTHLPFMFLPRGVREGKCKIIYVMRNPKDVTVSLHFFMKSFPLDVYYGSVLECGQLMLDGTCMFGPYWKHLQQYWLQRHRSNVFITTYEQMQQDLPGTVRAVAKFLGKRPTEEQVMEVAKWCSFSEMKSNPMANYQWFNKGILGLRGDFMRKGIVGDWKAHLSDSISRELDVAYERQLEPLGITFGTDWKPSAAEIGKADSRPIESVHEFTQELRRSMDSIVTGDA